MNNKYLSILKNFTINNLPDLDIAVLGALELFQKEKLPQLNELKNRFQRPLAVGSGNAEATGKIIFKDVDAIFASESNFEDKLKNISAIDGVIIISASGGKHAPFVAKKSKEFKKEIILITNNQNAPAKEFVEKENIFVFPKNREPYTYNTSTYLGMILATTGENPQEIQNFIENQISNLYFPDFSKYDKYFLIVPPQFSGIIRMLEVKFIELFGRTVARDVETSEYMKHAVTVVPSQELFISFGQKNFLWGDPDERFFVPLPLNANYGAMMAIGYYVIGQIQKAHPPYFKQHLIEYTKKASEIFGEEIKPIVE